MSSTAHPLCKVCKKAHGHREPHQWGNEGVAEVVETMGVLRDSPLLLGILERLTALEAQFEELRRELADVTRRVVTPVTEVTRPVTPGNGATGVMHNKVTNSPERLAYLREYAKKRRAEAKA